MVINISARYNGGFHPDIIMLPQDYYNRGTRLNTMEWLCLYSLCNSVLLLPCLMVYYIVCFVFTVFMVSLHGDYVGVLQYNDGGLLPDIILYPMLLLIPSGSPFKYHEKVPAYNPTYQVNVFTFFPLDWRMLRRRSRRVLIFLLYNNNDMLNGPAGVEDFWGGIEWVVTGVV